MQIKNIKNLLLLFALCISGMKGFSKEPDRLGGKSGLYFLENKGQVKDQHQQMRGDIDFGGSAIAGANSQQYTVTQNGSYTVTVRDGNGCENTSSAVNVSQVAVNEVSGKVNMLTLYPNPNDGTFVLKGTISSISGKAAVVISDAAGRIIVKDEVHISGDKIEQVFRLSEAIAPGMYNLKITSDAQSEVLPFIKR